jgi:predicted enzyme related to lactoylglutathione lyase
MVMAERTSYAPGTPSWVDLGTPDPEGAAAFYGAVFGWTAEMDPRPEAGGYGLFSLDGKHVAGVGPQQNPNMPPFWSVYITVADADETASKASALGATVVAGPMDVFDAGRMAVIQDPVGSFISVWQPNTMIGAQLVNQPGTFTWNDLGTNDLAKAGEFYQSLFGWGVDPMSGETATIWTLDGEQVCGAHKAAEGEFPAWSAMFLVEDTDKSAAQVSELGGSILMPPNDMGWGRGAVVADPHGAVFGIGSPTSVPD